MLASTDVETPLATGSIQKPYIMRPLLVLCLLLFESIHIAAQDSNFVLLRLPLNIAMRVPRNWWRIDGDLNRAIATNSEAFVNLAGMKSPQGRKNIFRANSMPRSTYAGVAIDIEDSDISPSDVRGATAQDLREYGVFMRDMIARSTAGTAMSIVGEYRVRKEIIDGLPAIICDYQRSGSQGPVSVRVITLFLAHRILAITLSHRISEAALWKPVIDYMQRSIQVEKGSEKP
jgi:hypothetical protein